MIVDRTKTLKSSIVSMSMRMTSSCVIHLRKLSWSWQLREPGTVGAGMEDKKKNYLPEALGKNRLYAVIVQHSSSIYSVGEPIMKGKHTSHCLQNTPSDFNTTEQPTLTSLQDLFYLTPSQNLSVKSDLNATLSLTLFPDCVRFPSLHGWMHSRQQQHKQSSAAKVQGC